MPSGVMVSEESWGLAKNCVPSLTDWATLFLWDFLGSCIAAASEDITRFLFYFVHSALLSTATL